MRDRATRRWVSVHSKESFAVKKTSAEKYKQRPELYDNEVRALELLKQHQVARVVKLVDTLVAANGDRYLVLEYVVLVNHVCSACQSCIGAVYNLTLNNSLCRFVKGLSLDRYLVAQSRLRYLSSAQEYEQGMLALGAQLVQASETLQSLSKSLLENRHEVHCKTCHLRNSSTCGMQTMEGMHSAGIAHMDLKPSNILMQPLTDSPAAIVIDFGSSQQISGGDIDRPTVSPVAPWTGYIITVFDNVLHDMQALYACCHAVLRVPFIFRCPWTDA